ncbi:MAG: hypothetical protein JW844_06970 [Candidatus Omnitrophica bacterium]|nr:hypothetical protein [Candidatus Omnitrophota bacterium]
MRKRKEYSFIIGVLAICLVSAGCAQVKKKFTRTPVQEPRLQHVLFQDDAYAVPPTSERYTQAYLFWKSWHDELIKSLTSNKKRQLLCAREAAGSMEKMASLLKEEQTVDLASNIAELRKLITRIEEANTLTTYRAKNYRNRLEKMYMHIQRIYHPSKVADWFVQTSQTQPGYAGPAVAGE